MPKKIGLTTVCRPYKALLSACAANCNGGTILAILKWRGGGECNAQRNLGIPLVHIAWAPSLSAAYRVHTVRHHEGFTWAGRCEAA